MSEVVTEVLTCANHPGRETLLRCNRCEKPICTECAIRTPVGFRCPECVRGQQAVYFTGQPLDLLLMGLVAFVAAAMLGALAYLFLGAMRFFGFIIAFVAGPAAGGVVAEVARRVVNRRRSRQMKLVVVLAALAGVLASGLLLMAAPALLVGAPASVLLRAALAVVLRLDVMLFTVLMLSTIYARLQ